MKPEDIDMFLHELDAPLPHRRKVTPVSAKKDLEDFKAQMAAMMG